MEATLIIGSAFAALVVAEAYEHVCAPFIRVRQAIFVIGCRVHAIVTLAFVLYGLTVTQ